MNKENASKLWKIIQEAGDFLKGQLPEHPNHPKGRNPYAHVAICIKNCLLYTSPSPRDMRRSRMPSSA